jgi:hypothetical protein
MPTAKRIVQYWSDVFFVEPKRCFACGDCRSLHRSHIVPVLYGGTHELTNLHMLCRACHDESEGIKTYNQWFVYKRTYEFKTVEHHAMDNWKKFGFDPYEMHEQLEKKHPRMTPEYFKELEEWYIKTKKQIYYHDEDFCEHSDNKK